MTAARPALVVVLATLFSLLVGRPSEPSTKVHAEKPADRVAQPTGRIAQPAGGIAQPADRVAQPAGRIAQPADERLGRVAEATLDLGLAELPWDWEAGVALAGLTHAWSVTGDQRFLTAAESWYAARLPLPPGAVSHPNHVAPGIALLRLAAATGEDSLNAAADALARDAVQLPREPGGGFLHAEGELWVDTLFMVVPFLAEYGRARGDDRYVDEAVRQYERHSAVLQTPRGDFLHGWRAVDGSRFAAVPWLRGNAWAAAAGALLLDSLPVEHPRRGVVEDAVRRQLAVMAALQPDAGVWPTVADRPDTYAETSGTAGLAFAVLRGLDAGWLSTADVGRASERSRAGMAEWLAADGLLFGVSSGTGPQATVAGYTGIARDVPQPWGQGLALLLLAERAHGYRLAARPSVLWLEAGSTGAARLDLVNKYGPEVPISLTLTAPEGVQVEAQPKDAGWSVTVSGEQPGHHSIAFAASSGDLVRRTTLAVKIVPSLHQARLPIVGEPRSAGAVRLAASESAWQPDSGPGRTLAFVSDRWGPPLTFIAEPRDVARRPPLPEFLEEDRPRLAADGSFWLGARTEQGWDLVSLSGPLRQFESLGFPSSSPSTSELHADVRDAQGPLTFSSDRSGDWRVYVAPSVDAPAVPVPGHGGAERAPQWMPDGRNLLYRAERGGNSDVYRLDTFTGALYRIADGQGYEGYPTASSDGEWIAFERRTSDGDRIFRVGPFGASEHRLTGGPGDDTTPAWATASDFAPPAASDLLFSSTRDGQRHLYSKTIEDIPLAPWPDAELARAIWSAIDSYPGRRPPEQAGFPVAPTEDEARQAVISACAKWPDDGSGASRESCRAYVAGYLALVLAGQRLRAMASAPQPEAVAQYLRTALDSLERLALPSAAALNDSRQAVWQNPLRLVSPLLAADILRREGALDAGDEARILEVTSAVVRAWEAEWWRVAIQPSSGVSLTTGTAARFPAFSLEGRPVTSAVPHTFSWDADRGNTPAEEAAWMAAGIGLGARVLWAVDPRAPEYAAAAAKFASLAVAVDEHDPRTGQTVTTLNLETAGGPHGQRRLWIENHAPDVPAMAYAGSTWHSLGVALLGDAPGNAQLAHGGEEQWSARWGSAEETFRAADGSWLVDMSPGGRTGFLVSGFPAWVGTCGVGRAGALYYRTSEAGRQIYLSEIGHPGGYDVLAAGVALARLGAERGDEVIQRTWRDRAMRVAQELSRYPAEPEWGACNVADFMTDDWRYHWARLAATPVAAALLAEGYVFEPWLKD